MLASGSILAGRYEIQSVINRRALSVMYLALDKQRNRVWAVKEMNARGVGENGEAYISSVLQEVELLRSLDHPVLIHVNDIFEENGKKYVVEDYVEGVSLDAYLASQKTIPEKDVIRWAKQIADGLSYLHKQTPPIIYRNMKPANLMLRHDGNIKIIDFGVAREYKTEEGSDDTAVLGTPGYAPVEQYLGRTDERSDIFSLGMTMHQLLTGVTPDASQDYHSVRAYNPSLSEGIERIIDKCTRKMPEERYQSCEDLIYDLEHPSLVSASYHVEEIHDSSQKLRGGNSGESFNDFVPMGDGFAYRFGDAADFLTTEYKVVRSDQNHTCLPCTKTSLNGQTYLFYMPLHQTLRQVCSDISLSTFHLVMHSLIESIQRLKNNGFLNLTNIYLNIDRIYVDRQTMKVSLVYIPTRRHLFDSVQAFETELKRLLLGILCGNRSLKARDGGRLQGALSLGNLNLQQIGEIARKIPDLSHDDGSSGSRRRDSCANILYEQHGRTGPASLRLRPVNNNPAEVFVISQGKYVIGRKREMVDGCITSSRQVGRRHAAVVCNNGVFTLNDLNSMNGTFVNNRRISQSVVLHNGDHIRFGNVEFVAEFL